jgi:hypothetical protein
MSSHQKMQERLFKIDGAFVLTHDEEVSQLKRCLGDYELILGLEFTHVVLLIFFRGLSDEHHNHGEICSKAGTRST